ncbi:MAG: PKD domain-containing protein, partial [Bacteroidota bacterium]
VNFCDPTGQFSATQIKIRPKPLALFAPPDTLCFPGQATASFINNSCPNPTLGYTDPLSFQWTFGEPSTGALDTSFLANPTHTYTAPGKYTVTLIATNQCGADTTTREVVVIEAPTVFASADTNQVCVGGCVNYTNFTIPDTAIANTDFLWTLSPTNGFNFPMGSSPTQHSPTICFNQPGTYFVQLRAENECGVGFWQDTITVFAPPIVTLDTLQDTCGVFILDTLGYTFIDNGAPIQNYNWQFIGGTPATFNGVNFPPINFNPGLDTIVLSLTNVCGTRRDSISFFVDTVSNVFAGNDTILCRNDSGPVFQGLPGPGFWSGPSVNANSGKFIPDTVGIYELIYTYQAASCRVYDTLLVTVVDTPVVAAMADMAFCFDTVNITLNANPIGGAWSGPVPLQGGNIFSVDSAGIFTFTYTFFDPISNCEGRDQVRIEVYPIPDVDAGPDTTYCLVPDPQQLPTPNFAGGTWAGIGVSNPNTGIYIPNLLGGPGVDTLTYTYTSADGCVGVDTILVTVVIGDNAIAGPGDSLCYNAAIDTLPGFSPAGGAWSGIGITNAGAGEYNPLLMPPGQNQLIYTVAAGTSCEAADTTFVLVYDTLAVTLPPDITVCASDPDFPITGFAPAGGTWIGNGVSPTGVFSPTAVTPGTTSILTYTVVNADGCSSRETMEVFVA